MKQIKTGTNPLKEGKISRRSFLSSIVTVWGAILTLPFIYGIVDYLSPPGKKFTSFRNKLQNKVEVTSIPLSELPENSSKFIKIDDEPVLVIRKDGMNIIAFSAICTHLDCLVGYRKNEKDIICNCHGSTFNLDGMPQEGPAKEPLSKYNLTIEGDKITISNPI
ncbi:MAG: Rieske (2Fe-2S) protein [Ignavibacteriae bacterium]|nr:MAG: Rieske (2Fe-2S) protein [Ignavibacteriota bacterium]